MPDHSKCPVCGAVVPPDGRCANCLRRLDGVGAAPLEPDPSAPTVPESAAENRTAPAPQRSNPNADVAESTGDRIGRYKLLQQIGEGGMGTVWMAMQEEPVRRRVALKVIKLGMDTRQVVARFEAERQALALMDHPNIAKVLDGGATESGRPYFAMELVQGIPITRFCDEARLDTRQRLDLFMQVCGAIQHAHQKGIIHRDIKPSNVLVTLHGDQPVPKVIDFGIAKSTQQPLTDKTLFTQFQQFMGTPAYMSPEQASLSGLDVDTRSDIYALGVLLYELLTGKTPFDTKSLLDAGYAEILRIIREVEPPRPSTRLSTMAGEELTTVAKQRGADPKKLGLLVRGDLDWIVMKALEKDRARRYETANGLASDVRRFLNNEPVSAVAPSAGYKLRKFVSRNRTAVFAGATIAFLLVAGITTTSWLAVVATKAKETAVKAGKEATKAKDAETGAREKLQAQLTETEKIRRSESTQWLRVQEALQRAEIEKAEEYFRAGQPDLGVAYLGQVLRTSPSNQIAATRLVSAVLQGEFERPVSPVTQFVPDDLGVVRFSPDGELVLTGSKTVRIWDAHTGKPCTEPLTLGEGAKPAEFSPDGKLVVTASADNTAQIWEARTGKPHTKPLLHEGPVLSAQFNPDGKLVVTASRDKTARIWDVHTGGAHTGALPHESSVASAQFSPDGNLVLTVCDDGTACIWDAHTGKLRVDPLRGVRLAPPAQFSPDSDLLLTRSDPNTAQIWDVRTGKLQASALRCESGLSSVGFNLRGVPFPPVQGDDHEGGLRSIGFSPSGKLVVAFSPDGTVCLWDALTGKLHTDPTRLAETIRSISADRRRVVTTSTTAATGWGTARVWDASTGRPLGEPLLHAGGVISTTFSPDGERLLTTSSDKSVCVWDWRAGRILAGPLWRSNFVGLATFSPDGERVLTAPAVPWFGSIKSRATRSNLTVSGSSGVVLPEDRARLLLAAQQEIMLRGGRGNEPPLANTNRAVGPVEICDIRPRLIRRNSLPLRHRGAIRSALFSHDGLRVITVTSDGAARVWDARTGEPLTALLRHESSNVSWAELSLDGLWAVTVTVDGTARFWAPRSGEPLTPPLQHESSEVLWAELSPDGKRVITTAGGLAIVWDARAGKPVTAYLRHGPGTLSLRDFDPEALIENLKQPRRAVDAWLVEHLSATARAALRNYGDTNSRSKATIEALVRDGTLLVRDLNTLLPGPSIYEPQRFEGVVLRPETEVLLAQNPQGFSVARLNRLLIEDAYPKRSRPNAWSKDYLHSARFTDDGHRIVTESEAEMRLWDARTGQPLDEPPRPEDRVKPRLRPKATYGRAVDCSGSTAIYGGWPFRHEARVRAAELSPDDQRLVTASDDGTARVWDSHTGLALTEPLRHEGPVASAHFSPDGQWVVTISQRRDTGEWTARVWDVPRSEVPVPEWFISWAEALAGQRIGLEGRPVRFSDLTVAPLARGGERVGPQGTGVEARASEGSERRDEVAARKDTNFFARVAQWAESDVATRTISPDSPLTRPGYVARRIQENTIPGLREAIQLSPTNSVAFARLAMLLKDQDQKQNPGSLEEATFYALYASKLDRKSGEAWRTLASVQAANEQATEALRSLDRALELQPENVPDWTLKGQILEQSNQPVEALAAFTRAVELSSQWTNTTVSERSRASLGRGRVLRQLGRLSEYREAMAIPQRQPQTDRKLVDLSAFYNASLNDDWHAPKDIGNNLSLLPVGLQTFAGVNWDVRGIVQLNSRQIVTDAPGFPERVAGIPVGAKGAKVHFLHSAGWRDDDGTIVARYIIHYADGSEVEAPVAYGRDLRSWQFWPTMPPRDKDGGTIAWTGTQERWRNAKGYGIRLYLMTWPNPHPEKEIATIDLISTMQDTAPFVIAITLEP